MTEIAKESVVATLTEEWSAIERLLTGLSPDQWTRPTCLPGWRVTDVVAHMVGTEAALSGDEAPASDVDVKELPHVVNDIGAFNELWVRALRDEPPAAMLERFRDVTSRRTAALEKMTKEEFDAPSWTPAGQGTYGRFMQIRIYDCWTHEQDIRAAVGAPGNDTGPAAERSLDEAANILGFVVGKQAAAPEGSTILVELTGPMTRRIFVQVEDRARLVPSLTGPPTATLTMESSAFLRRCGGRESTSDVHLDGDLALAQRVVDNLAFTI